jgi:flagellar biosynthesis protein FliR
MLSAAVWAWLLVVARVAPIAWWAPPGDDAPVAVRAALGLGLSALIARALPATSVAQIALMSDAARIALAAREAAIGAVIAVLAAVPVMMAEAAGRLADVAHRGELSGAGGPGDDAGPLARFSRLAALVVFFGIGGHLAVARALADSYAALPLGAMTPAGAPAIVMIERVAIAAAQLIAAGLWIAAPWLITAAVVEIGAAAARRAAGAIGGMAPVDGARQIAVVAAVGLGAVAAAAIVGGQVRAAMATIATLWT